MSKALHQLKKHIDVSNPKTWIVIAAGVAGIVILVETRRRKRRATLLTREGLGAFVERFELLPFPQPPPPASRLLLSGFKFAVTDIFDVKGYVTGFGSTSWKRTHEEAAKTAVAVTALLKNGATCVGKTVLDELSFGITGENMDFGSPANPVLPSHIPGGSSSGSAVAVASQLVDFAIGTDTNGGVRVPASFCGILGYRPSHGAVSTIGVLPSSQSLDTVGWFARDPSILHRVGHILLQINPVEPRRVRNLMIADDLFQLSKVPKQKTVHVVNKVAENLSGYQPPKHVNFGQYIASNVPSLKGFHEQCEFKTNHEEWVKSVKPRLGPEVSDRVLAAINTTHANIKIFIKSGLKCELPFIDDGILVIPTVADPPLKLNSKKAVFSEFHDRAFTLLSIASMSGCCQVTVPLGKHEDFPISVSFIAFHGADKFLLDTVLDMYPSLQEQASITSNSLPLPDTNALLNWGQILLQGNAAFKGRQWNKAVNYYTEAIKLNETNATYYCNRAAAYLELGCFQQAVEDCSKAILLDKRRGTARESLLCYKEAAQDFKHALVLEPRNKVANLAEKRLRKLMS
ncbi:hypothetical protein AAG906_026417 [Vitis piasezkii]